MLSCLLSLLCFVDVFAAEGAENGPLWEADDPRPRVLLCLHVVDGGWWVGFFVVGMVWLDAVCCDVRVWGRNIHARTRRSNPWCVCVCDEGMVCI